MRRTFASAAFLVGICSAQPPARPAFEVASIKPAALDPSRIGSLAMAGQIRMGPRIHENSAEYVFMTLRQLVSEAYRTPPSQIVCPPWFLEDRFDIVARLPAGDRAPQAPLMLQSLLEDRFSLALHRETREESVAALVIVEGGAKLTRSRPDPPGISPSDTPSKPPPPNPNSFGGMLGSVAVHYTIDEPASTVRMAAKNVSMSELARLLTNFGAGGPRPVVDQTRLDGDYDISIDLPLSTFGAGAASPNAASTRPADYASAPGAGSIVRSLRRYGLDLKNRKAPLEYLVVDRADRKPAEN